MLLFDSLDPASRPRELADAVRSLGQTDETERGAVFTRSEVAHAILDLAGYDPQLPLHRLRLLEPSCGAGDFLLPALDRLLSAYGAAGGKPGSAAKDLRSALFAVEVHPVSLEGTAERVRQRLIDWGISARDARALSDAWLHCDDFLLTPLSGLFDFVVGNPPYVRLERVPPLLTAEYRRRYRTLYDRADLYVAFYERGLDLLSSGGRLAFICANRWIKNRYGGPLRERIARSFHLEHIIDLEGADAFHSEVDAYPAITVIRRTETDLPPARMTRVVHRPELSPASLDRLIIAMRSADPDSDPRIEQIETAGLSGAPWLLDNAARIGLLRRFEQSLPDLESAGCRVGIGVATGCDAVFIGNHASLPVEDSRKLPLVMAPDLKDGSIRWGGKGVVNPFEPSGALADFARYPRFAAFIRGHEASLNARHCAKKNPNGWYRTIDRIWPDLVATPKLLIPDIKGEAWVVYDEGRYYPHHNLYFVTSTTWDLRALQAVLRSSVALWFVASYCVKMAGGFLRFQAQYLRRIRLPRWDDVPMKMRQKLAQAAECPDIMELDAVVFELYGLGEQEAAVISSAAAGARVRPRRDTKDAA